MFRIYCLFIVLFSTSILFAQSISYEEVVSYQKQADNAYQNNDFTTAQLLHLKLLQYYQKTNEVDSIFKQVNRLAHIHYFLDQTDSVAYYFRFPGKKGWWQQVEPKHTSYNLFQNLRGVFAYQRGDYTQVGKFFEEVLESEMQADSLNYEDISFSLNNLGTLSAFRTLN